METSFSPMWCSPPGSTIKDVLNVRRISLDSFAQNLSISKEDVQNIIAGRSPLTEAMAAKLATNLGGSKEFWIRRDREYRQDFDRLQSKISDDDARAWLAELPLADMVAFGWVKAYKTLRRQLVECLQFFGVGDIAMWRHQYSGYLESYSFRTSAAFQSRLGAVSAWLRRGQEEADSRSCSEWDKEKFQRALSRIRGISRLGAPSRFMPKLSAACAECGVAVVVLRAPAGCRASGATRFVSDNKAMILLSFRHLSDDHFWFTFFHEAGHLILHDRKDIFVEGFDVDSDKEREADSFAERVIIPDEYRDEFESLRASYEDVARFSKKIGISPGVVVGQLQHRGRVPYHWLNNLKKKYLWT